MKAWAILVNRTLEIRRDAYYKKISKTTAIVINIEMNDLANKKEKLAFEEYKKLVGLIQIQSNLFLDMGFTLKRIRDQKLFKLVGDGGFETWGRFLSQPDIGIGTSTASFYIQIYEQYVDRLKYDPKNLKEFPFYKLQRLLPIIRKQEPDKAIETIDEIMPLGASDFNAEILRLKGVKESDIAPVVKRCKVCDGWVLLVSKNDKCHCEDTTKKKT